MDPNQRQPQGQTRRDAVTDLQPLTDQVTATQGVQASAVVLLNGLAAALIAAKQDPVAIQALADSLKSSSDDLATAVAANPLPA